MSIPTTWTEFTSLCKTLQSKGTVPALGMPSQDGVIPTFFWTGFMTTVRGPQGVSDLANGKAKLTDPDFLAATEYLQSLVPYLAPGFASTAYVEGKAAFAEGKNVLFEGGSADYTGFKNINPDVDLGFFAFPHSPNMGVSTVNSGIDYLYGLNSNVTEPAQIAAALAFFNFFLTPKVGTQIAETIELPDTKGAHTNVPIQEEIIQQSANDAPEWYQFDQLTDLWNYSLVHISDLLLGNITPKQYAINCQAQIKCPEGFDFEREREGTGHGPFPRTLLRPPPLAVPAGHDRRRRRWLERGRRRRQRARCPGSGRVPGRLSRRPGPTRCGLPLDEDVHR